MSFLRPTQVIVNWFNSKCSSTDHVIINVKPEISIELFQKVFIPRKMPLSCSSPKPNLPTFLLPPLWDDRAKDKDKQR